MKRLFIALEVPDFEKCAITLWREQALPEISSPVITDNLHLTLCFLGNLDPVKEQEIIAQLNHVHQKKFYLSFTEIGYFKKPKVLYLKPYKVPNVLQELATQICKTALQMGIKLDINTFKPHITVARKVPLSPTIVKIPNIRVQFTDMALYHSQSTTNGVRYKKLRSWPLY